MVSINDSEANRGGGKIKRVSRWISNYSVELLNAIVLLGTIIASGFGGALFSQAWWLVATLGIYIATSAYIQIWRTPYTAVKRQNEALDREVQLAIQEIEIARREADIAKRAIELRSDALERSVGILVKQMLIVFNLNIPSVRISAYYHRFHGDEELFELVARYSRNPSLLRAGRRKINVGGLAELTLNDGSLLPSTG